MREIGNVDCIGTTARKLLARRNCVGRVLAVVTGAVYLSVIARSREAAKQSPSLDVGIASQRTLATPQVLWLAQKHLPMHPRALCGEFDSSTLQTGMRFESDGMCLRFGTGDHPSTALRTGYGSPLRFADACVWQPRMIDPGRVAPRAVVLARAREIADLEGRRPSRSLRDLIGLGEGLTPAGDDFIGGLLFARWHLQQAYPGSLTWDQRAVDDLIDYARPRTNVISHALLRDHARGQSSEPMHDLIAALLQGESNAALMPHLQSVRAIGSTSGRALLAGVLFGMLAPRTDG